MHSRFLPVLALVALLIVAPSAYGQQADTTELPEIAPREIEIRGERQIALPSLERQPLSGFASPPQVPAVPTDRQPYVSSYTYSLDDLPESLPLPETVSSPMQPAGEPALGFLESGTGRYFSRFFEGRVGYSLSPSERVSVHGKYTGTEADPDDDVAEGRVQIVSNQKSVQIRAGAHGSVQRYALFGATPLTTSSSETPNRQGNSAGVSLGLQSTSTIPASASIHYDHAQYTSALDANADEFAFSQQQFEVQGSTTVPVRFRPHVNATYRQSWIGGDPQDDTAFDLDVTGTLSVFQSDSTSLELGPSVLAFSTPADPSVPALGTVDDAYFLPYVDAEWGFADGAILHVRNQPRLGDTSLEHLYATNPYAWHAPSLRPTLETTNAEAGLTLTRGPVRIVAAAGYRYAPTYRFYNLASQPQGDYSSLYQVRYESARIIQGRGQIALQGIDGVQASLGLSVRDGSLTSVDSLDSDIPNFAPVTADAIVAVAFAGGDGFAKATGRFASPRDVSMDPQARRLGSYFSIDLEGSYAVGSDMEIVTRLQNLSVEAPTLWAGYPRPPAQLSLGLRLKW